jgi:hypothetical protein
MAATLMEAEGSRDFGTCLGLLVRHCAILLFAVVLLARPI